MTRGLNLADIQGNVLLPYGKQGFPLARYLFLHVDKETEGRQFITRLLPKITTALHWDSKKSFPDEILEPRPSVTWNLAFTFRGLYALGLPTISLRALPSEFIDGMAARGHILGDRPERNRDEVQPAVPAHWDAIWRQSVGTGQVHVMLSLNAGIDPIIAKEQPDKLKEQMEAAQANLEAAYQEVLALCRDSQGGLRLLPGHGPDQLAYQEAHVLFDEAGPTKREHFGFADGIGDPVFKGQYPDESIDDEAIGQGKLMPDRTWVPLATGEFLLGYVDEAQEIPGDTYPFEFTRNGTFMAYRKLHEQVGSFRRWIDDTSKAFARHCELPETAAGLERARQTLMAKLSGRWPVDGVPVSVAPTWETYQAFRAREAAARAKLATAPDDAAAKTELAKIRRQYVDFTFRDDPEGRKCPVASHLRRVNPRDSLDPKISSANPKDWNGSALNNRRRLLRRGLPYGGSDAQKTGNDGEQGIVFMSLCASLFRQFEFVQQQWIQYGLDFNVGNDTCPLTGHHDGDAKLVIPADPGSDRPPFIAARIPNLIETRGGDYFFIPSMTGLRMLALGIVDPT